MLEFTLNKVTVHCEPDKIIRIGAKDGNISIFGKLPFKQPRLIELSTMLKCDVEDIRPIFKQMALSPGEKPNTFMPVKHHNKMFALLKSLIKEVRLLQNNKVDDVSSHLQDLLLDNKTFDTLLLKILIELINCIDENEYTRV